MNFFRRFVLLFLLFIPTFVIPFLVYAQGGGTPSGGSAGTPPAGTQPLIQLQNPLKKANNLYEFIKLVITDIIIPLGGVIVVIAIIYVGFKFVTARGNEIKIAEAKRALLYTTIGTAILLGAWAIATVIETTIQSIT